MIISAKALKGSLKHCERAVKNTFSHGPLASVEFSSKTNVGGKENEAVSFDYRGKIAVMKKGIIIAHAVIILATVGCVVCMKVKEKRKEQKLKCDCGC